jgi:putative Mg2+ transporter-C (MgtC) family protein
MEILVCLGELLNNFLACFLNERYNICMQDFFLQNGELILRLFVALILGSIIGAERALVHKEAGMKTHALVCVGAALFMIISEIMSQKYAGFSNFDPLRMASQIIVGIGFLGAGSIIFQGSRLTGLTTAGGLWVTAGIGMASGSGLLGIAIVCTVLVMFVFLFFNLLENPIRRLSEKEENEEKK